ncbi:MAG: hypothetical protein J6125_02545 [Clostridia bacterium]|nr:hypothetical protein [Clostridia bacterium]
MEYARDLPLRLIRYFSAGSPDDPPSLVKFAHGEGGFLRDILYLAEIHPDLDAAIEEAGAILRDKIIDWGLGRRCDAAFARYLLSEPALLWPSGTAERRLDVRIRVER